MCEREASAVLFSQQRSAVRVAATPQPQPQPQPRPRPRLQPKPTVAALTGCDSTHITACPQTLLKHNSRADSVDRARQYSQLRASLARNTIVCDNPGANPVGAQQFSLLGPLSHDIVSDLIDLDVAALLCVHFLEQLLDALLRECLQTPRTVS